MWITLLVLAILILFDQTTKYLAEKLLTVNKEVTLIPNVLNSRLLYNKGAAWSVLSDATWFLMIISLIACGILIYFLLKNDWKKKKCYSLAITLLLAGAFGNFIDRLFCLIGMREGVVDMIIFLPLDALWKLIFKSGFPIFNVADICVVIGVIILCIDIIFFQEKRAVK